MLAGLSHPIRTLSFEYLPGALEEVEACATRLQALGSCEFNWSPGETFHLAPSAWQTPVELVAALRTLEAQRCSGDVYARARTSFLDVSSAPAGHP